MYREVEERGDWHICTRNGTEAGREMVDVISEESIDPRLWLRAAFSTYSFIIQSDVSALSTATPALHLSVSLPHNPPSSPLTSQQNLTNLNLSSIELHSAKPIVSLIPFQFHLVFAAQL